LWDNLGEKRTWLERLSAFCFIWLVLGALIETGWEMTWVITNITGVIHGAATNSRWVYLVAVRFGRHPVPDQPQRLKPQVYAARPACSLFCDTTV
jgi:hypothetical protein